MKDSRVINKISKFIENEARSCSMDFGCETPLYVFRMLGGTISLEEITDAMRTIKFLT